MFRILHNYNAVYTDALIKAGIVNPNDGFKITQHCLTPKEKCFNEIAKKGGELYDLLKQYKTCFYIDRLHGGTYYSEYDYDYSLVEEYENLTSGEFLGFQVHELALTRLMDWRRIKTQMEKMQFKEWNEQNIINAVREVSANKDFLHFSSGSAYEYSRLNMPENWNEYIDDIRFVINDRQRKTQNRVLLCDSGFMTCGFDKETGVKHGFAEIGRGTPFTKMQIAVRRGVSKTLGREWGVYYEPWGGDPFSTYNYMENGQNEWYITNENFGFNFYTDGGSSMNLARRIFYYSLFSGANYMSEEWGQANTFYNWRDFELSPYGKIKKEFNNFARNFKDIVPFVPVAIVIPHEGKIFGVYDEGDVTFPNNDPLSDAFVIKRKIKHLFYDGVQIGKEDDVLTNSPYGGIFDILYDDSTENISGRYDLVIDFSGRIKGTNVVDGNDIPETENQLKKLLEKLLPFKIESDGCIDYLMFSDQGRKYISLFNHSGISKSVKCGETADKTAEKNIKLLPSGSIIKEVTPITNCDYTVENNVLGGRLSAGGILLIEYA